MPTASGKPTLHERAAETSPVASAIDADSTGRARGQPPTLHFLPRRLEMDRINIWFGENRAMPLKRERVGDPVWARAVAVFNRLVRKEAGVFRL